MQKIVKNWNMILKQFREEGSNYYRESKKKRIQEYFGSGVYITTEYILE